MQRDPEFGRRMRAARGWAGLSQRELAAEISARYPAAPASTQTIKKVEANDLSVKGSLSEWTVWVADATDTPDWFLEGGWNAPRHIRETPHMGPLSRAFEMRALVKEIELALRAEVFNPDQVDHDRLRRFGLTLREDESPDRLIGRLEELARAEDARGRYGVIQARRAERERDLIRQGASRERRERLMHQLPRAALRDSALSAESRAKDALAAIMLGEDDEALLHDLSVTHAVKSESGSLAADEIEDLAEAVANTPNALIHRFDGIENLDNASLVHLRDAITARLRSRAAADVQLAASSTSAQIPFPEGKLDRNLFVRFLSGEKLDQKETNEIQRALADPEVKRYFQAVADKAGVDADTLTHGFALGAITPRSAADAPLPAPPGELGRRAREHLPNSEDRERSQNPAERDAQRDTGT